MFHAVQIIQDAVLDYLSKLYFSFVAKGIFLLVFFFVNKKYRHENQAYQRFKPVWILNHVENDVISMMLG